MASLETSIKISNKIIKKGANLQWVMRLLLIGEIRQMNKINVKKVKQENTEDKIKKMLMLEQIFSEDEEYILAVSKIKAMINNN
ncbi:hypothetical protein ACT7C6_23900 [Bacillus paranthracis]